MIKLTKLLLLKLLRRFKHPIYSKFVNATKKYHAHDEKIQSESIGDVVTIIESRPYSKLKKWELVTVK